MKCCSLSCYFYHYHYHHFPSYEYSFVECSTDWHCGSNKSWEIVLGLSLVLYS